jgi:hypothetical protein
MIFSMLVFGLHSHVWEHWELPTQLNSVLTAVTDDVSSADCDHHIICNDLQDWRISLSSFINSHACLDDSSIWSFHVEEINQRTCCSVTGEQPNCWPMNHVIQRNNVETYLRAYKSEGPWAKDIALKAAKRLLIICSRRKFINLKN